MKRLRYPTGDYILQGADLIETGKSMRSLFEELGYTIIKEDQENEGEGILLIAANKTRTEVMHKERLSHMIPFIGSLLEDAFRPHEAYDMERHRVGIEAYLWPVENGVLLELFVLPYMEHLNRPEIFKLTESRKEEIMEWHVCNLIWNELTSVVKEKQGAKPLPPAL